MDDNFQLWCLDTLEFLKENHPELTTFPRYYDVQILNFLVLRQLLPEYFTHYQSILEIGCGIGVHSLLLSRFTDKLLGVDMPGEYPGYLPKGFSSSAQVANTLVNKIYGVGHASFADAFPHDLPCESNSVDLIFSWTVLEHIPNLEAAYSEMHRVLRPGGLMLHVVPCIMSAMNSWVRANIKQTPCPLGWIGAVKHLLREYLKLVRIGIDGGVQTPACHSEFLADYHDQLNLYLSDSFIHPLLKLGVHLEHLLPIRDYNFAIVVRKSA